MNPTINDYFVTSQQKAKYLRNLVLNDLADYLGIYKEKATSIERTAIAIIPHPDLGEFYPPEDWEKIGLQVVIRNGESDAGLSFNGAQSKRCWYIELSFWFSSSVKNQAYNLVEAKEALVCSLANHEIEFKLDENNFVRANKKLGVPASITVTVYDFTQTLKETPLVIPFLVDKPIIKGEPLVGTDLIAVASVIGNPNPTLAYQWFRSGNPISGAVNSTYTLISSDLTETITVSVTATNTQGSDTRISLATEAIV